MAGMKNRKQRIIFMTRSLPAPFFRKTATGGMSIERMISTSLLSMISSLVELVTTNLFLLSGISVKLTPVVSPAEKL
jgi:hypothetical protein